jgi:predicted porin
MNNKIKLAVASSVLALSATANAGIVIPAGDWTLDVNGNVNAFATWSDADKTKGTAPTGGMASVRDSDNESNTQEINTGLLPSWLGFTGTTRQNDVDVAFTISMQPRVSDNGAAGDAGTPLFRQSFVTFGDKSWGTVKLGKDLGIFAGQAISNDMTLLGVGGGASMVSGANTTYGGIGTGYIYAAWKGQVSYTTPNMNGFTATIGITNPNQGATANNAAVASDATNLYQDRYGIEGQAMYEWTGDVAGKVWASFASYDVTGNVDTGVTDSYTADVYDIGVALNSGNAGLVAYYYDGDGVGTTVMHGNGAYANTTTDKFKKRDSDGGYIQATYIIPTGTKLGVAYGVSNLDNASGQTEATLIEKNERWTVGAYHPLTKHLNLVAEYNKIESEGQSSANQTESDHFSLGAILFF